MVSCGRKQPKVLECSKNDCFENNYNPIPSLAETIVALREKKHTFPLSSVFVTDLVISFFCIPSFPKKQQLFPKNKDLICLLSRVEMKICCEI